MEQLINIGFGNFINRYKMIAVISPDSAPAKRMIQNGKEQGTVIENNHIVLSAVLPETIAGRCGQQ